MFICGWRVKASGVVHGGVGVAGTNVRTGAYACVLTMAPPARYYSLPQQVRHQHSNT